MQNSILKSVKQKLNLDPEYNEFDDVIVDHINTALTTLHQLGVGPVQGFMIEDENAQWGEFLGGPSPLLNAVRTYVALHTRLAFDPPDQSFVVDSLNEQLREHIWRIEVMANPAPPIEHDLVLEETI